MSKVLIIGPSGSGKSYLAKELSKLGINAIDADLINDLHSWYDGEGNKVAFPKNADEKFLDNHQFLWDKKYLEKYLSDKDDLVLLGLSGNIFEMIVLFDKVYFLTVPDEILVKRLDSKDRDNPMGKTEYQKRVVIDYAHKIERKAKKLNIDFIDGILAAEEISRLLCRTSSQ